MSAPLLEALERCRVAEKEQALLYRALAGAAEARGDESLAERLHGLHADEQHHLSRLTARMVELGGRPAELAGTRAPAASLEGWEADARAREAEEVRRYDALLAMELDEVTRSLVEEIGEVERHHVEELGGKWTMA